MKRSKKFLWTTHHYLSAVGTYCNIFQFLMTILDVYRAYNIINCLNINAEFLNDKVICMSSIL